MTWKKLGNRNKFSTTFKTRVYDSLEDRTLRILGRLSFKERVGEGDVKWRQC